MKSHPLSPSSPDYRPIFSPGHLPAPPNSSLHPDFSLLILISNATKSKERQNENERIASRGIWELENSGNECGTESMKGTKIKMLAHIVAGNNHPELKKPRMYTC